MMSASSSEVSLGKPGWGLSRILSVVGLIAAAIYIVAMWVNLPVVELITKGIPLLCMIIWLFKLPRDGFANLIMAGLIIALVADLVLQWSTALFVPGLLIFLVAQIVYIVAFVSMSKRGRWVRLIPFAVWGLIAFLILNPYLGDLMLPVVVYLVAIEVMMWRAAALPGSHGRLETFELAALVGALAFGLSAAGLESFHLARHADDVQHPGVCAVYRHVSHDPILVGAIGDRVGRRVGSERSRAHRGQKITHDNF
jgi:alkenylglycerophosphocholine/alkenylglycerophosphoethanolamine hydrolase